MYAVELIPHTRPALYSLQSIHEIAACPLLVTQINLTRLGSCVSLNISPCSYSGCIDKTEDSRATMLIKEYRIPLPLTVEEYRIAQLYMIQVCRSIPH